ncbi:SH3 domain-binding protein 5-like isoform X3 [Lepidochelys kempii]|uniref:SH3 domain-binding protein 5-like isoform X3 n=1 Tax=Lepidochelys kempii TaxID=8472 RepID=UPI003C6EEB2D
MEDSDQRLVLGMNVGDGRQTPPGELRTPTQEGEELRAPIPEDVCSGDETKMPLRDEEDVEEELDPRIQEELEHLNQANEEINRVELQLDEARTTYRRILSESARKLNTQGSQLGNCIEKARPYYEARRLAKEAQQETQKAALRYERAVSMHNAAREMVFVAEQGVMADKNRLDPTWQEMLNHATCKEHKAKVTGLEQRVSQAKMRYSVALRNLEQISEQIHARRLQRLIQRRASPVGAEAGAGLGAECPPTDTLSMLSLQTIASDLQKFDSVEHLLGLSDAASLNSDELEEQERRRGGQSQFKHHRSVSL